MRPSVDPTCKASIGSFVVKAVKGNSLSGSAARPPAPSSLPYDPGATPSSPACAALSSSNPTPGSSPTSPHRIPPPPPLCSSLHQGPGTAPELLSSPELGASLPSTPSISIAGLDRRGVGLYLQLVGFFALVCPLVRGWAPKHRIMGASAQETGLWKQIDDAEDYLLSGLFEQAVSTALSVSDQVRTVSLETECDREELLDILESAGMVLVQALKELRRTSEMFVQLKKMFGSVASVPATVFLTGATMQMAAGSGFDLRPIFEEYLAKWRYRNDEVYVLNGGQDNSSNGFVVSSVMSTKQYLEVAELYTVTFLCIVSQESETAISWAEKAELTELGRKDLLKKVYALRSAANKKPSTVEGVKQTAERNLSTSTNGSIPSVHEDAPSTAPVYDSQKVQVKSTRPSIQHVTNQFDPLFWWFHSVRLRFGKIHIVLPSGKLILLFSLLFSTIYVLWRKTAGWKRTVFQHASSLRRAFFDALQLAFSVQMNPLAAVQQVPHAPR